jgi:type III restriction enzyme
VQPVRPAGERGPGFARSTRNFDEHGNPLGRPRTLLIDSEQLDSGEALDKNFRAAAGDEIERLRREIVERTGNRVSRSSTTSETR